MNSDIGQMAIAIALLGFSDLGLSVTPIFLLMYHFLFRFSTFIEKRKKSYRLEGLDLLENPPWNYVLFSSCLSVRRFQMPLEWLNFVKTLATFGIINATDSLIQNIYQDSFSPLMNL